MLLKLRHPAKHWVDELDKPILVIHHKTLLHLFDEREVLVFALLHRPLGFSAVGNIVQYTCQPFCSGVSGCSDLNDPVI